MIKNLLNADEDPPPGTKVIIEETVISAPAQNNEPAAEESLATAPETEPGFEIPEDATFFAGSTEPTAEPEPVEDISASASEPSAPLDEDSESLSALMADIENLDDKELDSLEKRLENAAPPEPVSKRVDKPEIPKPFESETAPPLIEQAEAEKTAEKPFDVMPSSGTLFQTEEPPRQSMAETIRQSGLAYSAAIVLVGSVVFTMILGWFADLLLGSSPWGIVGGIILGGIIGFIQFFRITSQIFKK